MKTAKYQYGQKIKVNWHEAEAGVTDCMIVGLRMTSEFDPPDYEVKELDEHGNMTAGSIDVDEEMISLC